MIVSENNKIKSVGQYKVIKKIASGGFSQVYLVEDTFSNNRQYTLKVLKNSNYKKRLLNEVNIIKQVNTHKNILSCHKFFKEEGRACFLYDYITHGDLGKNTSLSNEAIFQVIDEMCDVLLFLKSKFIIHKDIKETNILKADDKYLLCDWGISEQKENIETLHIKSDDDIIAPEVFFGNYSFPSDVYSLGCTLYYLCTQKYIYDFDKESSYAYKMYAHIKLQPNIESISSNTLQYLILRMTDKNPSTRITPEEIKQVLEENSNNYEIKSESTNYALFKEKNSLELYEDLSKEGVLFAMNNLAIIYEDKQKNYKKAFSLYQIAAQKGFIKSMYNVALCYLDGEGTEKNEEKAFAWFKKAALKNHEKAIYRLANFYEEGLFVQKSLDKAISLYVESAHLGYKEAYEKLHELKKA